MFAKLKVSSSVILPLVSVVIPFYNRIEFTLRAINSVFSQNYREYEIIVINDGSTEDDSMLIDFFSTKRNLTYIKLPKNVGPAEARNVGINAAKGNYIAFLDSDDTWKKEKLSIQIDCMLTKGWNFSHTSYNRHDTRNGKVKVIRSGLCHYIFPFPAFHCLIATPSVIVDRNLLKDFSFRPDLRFAEDTLLWLALSKKTVLHGIHRPLVNVFTGNLTTALNFSIQERALQLLAKDGLKGHGFLQGIHLVYRLIRTIQRRISRDLKCD